MEQYFPTVRETTVFADHNKPFVARTTRWDYMSRFFPLWKDVARFRLYVAVLVVLGVYFLMEAPPLAVLAFAGATYFFQMIKLRRIRLGSQRKVMINH